MHALRVLTYECRQYRHVREWSFVGGGEVYGFCLSDFCNYTLLLLFSRQRMPIRGSSRGEGAVHDLTIRMGYGSKGYHQPLRYRLCAM